MATWRLRQILWRNRLTRFCLVMALLLLLSVAGLSLMAAPFFALILLSFLAGIFTSLCMAFQLADDLNYSWAERCMGIAHGDFMSAYERVAFRLGAPSAAAITLYWLILGITRDVINLDLVLHAVKLGFAVFIPCFIMPHLMFQVDGRRPSIQAMLVILIGLFLTTAVYASVLSIILLPLFRYYAAQAQAGRFYRA